MATAKKSAASKKSTAKKATAKKTAPKKSTKKSTPKAAKRPTAAVREDKLAAQALKFVDEAAGLLRTGIRTSANETAKARLAAKKRAHSLINRASLNLGKAVDSSTSMLKNVLGKL